MYNTLDVGESQENPRASELLMDRIQYVAWYSFPLSGPQADLSSRHLGSILEHPP